eukprot:365700-Chlamydomonas_euryale.AAC.10
MRAPRPPAPARALRRRTVAVKSLLPGCLWQVGLVHGELPPVLVSKRHSLFLGVKEQRSAPDVLERIRSGCPAHQMVLPPGSGHARVCISC